jgi:excisionase family DNA binding protein
VEALFTKKEAAAYLKVSERTVDRLIQEMNLLVYKVGHQIRIPESALRKMMVREGMTTKERNRLVHDLTGV